MRRIFSLAEKQLPSQQSAASWSLHICVQLSGGGGLYIWKDTLTGIGRLLGWLDRETIAVGQTVTCGWMDEWI